MDARKIIPEFDNYLRKEGLVLQATMIGGAALQLMGLITRPTNDCDILDPMLDSQILSAADAYAETQPQLSTGWFNNGPASLVRTLPGEWSQRLQPLFTGKAIQLTTLGREDLLRSKLFAMIDRNIDLPDCVALAPTRDEVLALLPWLNEQDGNERWPEHVRDMLQALGGKLGYEL